MSKNLKMTNLKAYHERLARENYVSPPPKENPLVFKETKNGKKKLTDEDVIWARENVKTMTFEQMMLRLGVSSHPLKNALKGLSFKHLNHIVKPQW